MSLKITTAVLLFLCLIPSLCKAEIKIVDVGLRMTYDRLALPANEPMGLLGSSFLIDKKLSKALTFSSGLSVYSAVTGKRGGFFTGGIAAGLKGRIERWILDAGFFVGGGGGGAAPQGGGLMLRPHLAILRDFQTFRLGLFFSKTKFPNGDIDSNQFGLQVERPFQMVVADPFETNLKRLDFKRFNLGLKKITIAPTLQIYRPKSEIKDRSGLALQSRMLLIGIEAGIARRDNLLFYVEAAGALKGEADGFAELLGGIAYAYPLNALISLRFKGAIGSAGGGAVDTAGGIIVKITTGLSFAPSRRLLLNFDYGIVDAPKGGFQAQMFKSSVAYQIDTAFPLSQGNRLKKPLDAENLKLGKWSVRTSLSRYLSSSSLRKNRSRDEAVDLFQIKLDRALSTHVYFTGQAGGAVNGGVGGYATGLFGLGFQKNMTSRITALVELLAGAGGGGGIASDGGSIVQAMFGIIYRISQNFDIQFLIGRIKALKGDLDTKVIDVGLVLPFSTIESK